MPLRSGARAKSKTGRPTHNQGRSEKADLSIGQRARPHIGVVDVISERRHQVVAIAVAGWEPRSVARWRRAIVRNSPALSGEISET